MNSALRLEWLTCSSTVLSACAAPPALPPAPTYALSCCVVVPAAASRATRQCGMSVRLHAARASSSPGRVDARARALDRMQPSPSGVRVNPAAREQCDRASRHGAWARARRTRLRYACTRYRAPSAPARDAAAPCGLLSGGSCTRGSDATSDRGRGHAHVDVGARHERIQLRLRHGACPQQVAGFFKEQSEGSGTGVEAVNESPPSLHRGREGRRPQQAGAVTRGDPSGTGVNKAAAQRGAAGWRGGAVPVARWLHPRIVTRATHKPGARAGGGRISSRN
jgi:hypothetical protein